MTMNSRLKMMRTPKDQERSVSVAMDVDAVTLRTVVVIIAWWVD